MQLSQWSTYQQYVRYSGVTNTVGSPNGTWSNALGSSPAYSNAEVRYAMAAYLVSQYPGVAGQLGASGSPTIANGDYDAIQEAIWDITNNNTSADPGYNDGVAGGVGNLDSVAYWVAQAEANYSTVNLNNWAVVSWTVDPPPASWTGPTELFRPPGRLFFVNLTPSQSIVTIGGSGSTPEPGFYGALALGLGGLLFAVGRRKKA